LEFSFSALELVARRWDAEFSGAGFSLWGFGFARTKKPTG
jgi:hypothetical protein